MLEVVQRELRNFGRPSKLSIADQLFVTLSDTMLKIKSEKGYAAKEACKVNEKRTVDNIS